ncbi:MAG: hypothetical protein LHW51_01110 [Candidatus Cloacimonetes bacterium]|nr:hypothetical protein [Candidatus Cloacimonadota bacterium]
MKLLALALMILSLPLGALMQESSAMANALSGLSILSESVADYSISPVMKLKGLSSFYTRPFNLSQISIFGLHNAVNINNLYVGLGNTYLYHQDYIYHNPYLNAHYCWHGFALGASSHMIYDAVDEEDGNYDWAYDLGVAYNWKDYGAELKLLRQNLSSSQLCLSLKTALSSEVNIALGYVNPNTYEDFFRIGMVAYLHEYISVIGSWQNEPNRFGTGVQLRRGKLALMYSIRTHTDLNPTHSLSLDVYW